MKIIDYFNNQNEFTVETHLERTTTFSHVLGLYIECMHEKITFLLSEFLR